MPNGLKFQRKHRFWGYKLKYLYYCIAKGMSYKRKRVLENIMRIKLYI